MLYNKSLKQRFLRSYTQSLNTEARVLRIFEKIAPYEQEWEADLCTKGEEDVHEIEDVIDEVLGLTSSYRWSGLTILREYVKWCIAAGVPGAKDGLLHAYPLGLEKIRNAMVPSPAALQNYLDSAFEPESKETMDIVCRAYFWLLFMGVDANDMAGIQTKDVDLSTLTLNYKGKSYQIYGESLPTFRSLLTLDHFMFFHDHSYTYLYFRRVEGTQLLRGFKAEFTLRNTKKSVLGKLNRALEREVIDRRLTMLKTQMSGLFYRTLQIEVATGTIDFSETVSEIMKNRMVSGEYEEAVLRAQEKQETQKLMQDYMRWKLAFGL